MNLKVSFKDCGKSFNRQWLFRNVNCAFNVNEKWAFLGSNGSGKTTLTMLIAAQTWPTEGAIQWDYNNQTLQAAQAFSIVSLASPAMELPEEFNLKEIISSHAALKPFSIQNPLDALAELCEFDHKTLMKPIANFSSGMKQRVKLCLAAFTDTPILILDEPLTNLDKSGALVFQNILDNYTQNRLLIIASNREDEYGICNRFIQLSPGGHVEIK